MSDAERERATIVKWLRASASEHRHAAHTFPLVATVQLSRADECDSRAGGIAAGEHLRASPPPPPAPPGLPVREIKPFGGEDPATCEHKWEPHLYEQGHRYCPYCCTIGLPAKETP